jgi:hypothetical protein
VAAPMWPVHLGGRSQSFLEFDLVAQRNSVLTHLGNLRFKSHAAVIDRPRVDGRESKAASLIEAKRIDVVVGGDEPQARTAEIAGQPLDGLNKRGAHSAPLFCGVKRDDLALLPVDDVCENPGERPMIFGEQRGTFNRMDELAEPRNLGGFMLSVERKDVGMICRLLGANVHRAASVPRSRKVCF